MLTNYDVDLNFIQGVSAGSLVGNGGGGSATASPSGSVTSAPVTASPSQGGSGTGSGTGSGSGTPVPVSHQCSGCGKNDTVLHCSLGRSRLQLLSVCCQCIVSMQ